MKKLSNHHRTTKNFPIAYDLKSCLTIMGPIWRELIQTNDSITKRSSSMSFTLRTRDVIMETASRLTPKSRRLVTTFSYGSACWLRRFVSVSEPKTRPPNAGVHQVHEPTLVNCTYLTWSPCQIIGTPGFFCIVMMRRNFYSHAL